MAQPRDLLLQAQFLALHLGQREVVDAGGALRALDGLGQILVFLAQFLNRERRRTWQTLLFL